MLLTRQDIYRARCKAMAIAVCAISVIAALLMSALWAVDTAYGQDAEQGSISTYLTWDAPTAWTDGTPLVGASLLYSVYDGMTNAQLARGLLVPKLYLGGLPPGMSCWYVTVVVRGVESKPSKMTCKTPPTVGTAPERVTNVHAS